MDCGIRINSMVLESSSDKMGINMKESFSRERSMGEEFQRNLTGKPMLENGIKTRSMERGNLLVIMGMSMMENG